MTYHFIGMGGIGMSALARILLERGAKVQGSDMKDSPLLQKLAKDGARVHIGHAKETLEQASVVVVSTDIGEDNVELQEARKKSLRQLHRSDLLHNLIGSQKPLLVTGTHGKTTTSALLAAVLLEAGADPSFVVGGIVRSCNTNGRSGKGPYFALEADESDGSFLKTPAFGAIATNVEKEHMNYWKTEERLKEGFRAFFKQAMHPEHLFWCLDDPILAELNPKGVSYGFSPEADLSIQSYEASERGVRFDLRYRGVSYKAIELSLFGRHNALNGSAVFGLALSLGIEEAAIRRAFISFAGAARRLEKVGCVQNIEVFDDYGHHPTEIRSTLKAMREKIREKRLVAIVQPHRYSRIKDLIEEFPAATDEADEVILTDIYAAGEAPIEGATTERLYQLLQQRRGAHAHWFPRQGLEQKVAEFLQCGDVAVAFGAGDITAAARNIPAKLSERMPKLTIGVLFGGTSAEHAISLMSARNVIRSLDPDIYNVKTFGLTKDGHWIFGEDALARLEKHERIPSDQPKLSGEILKKLLSCDAVVPVLHGPQGEDGMVQGLLDALDLPYVGCDYRAAAICMQKAWTKHVAVMNGVPTAPYVECSRSDWQKRKESIKEFASSQFDYPLWVKPVHLGSSIGVSRVLKKEFLDDAVELAFQYDHQILIEKEVDGRQIEFAVLGNDEIRVGAPGEILNHGQFYDFERKYGPQSLGTKTPADLTEQEAQIGKDLARRMYAACCCKGLARVDFFLDRKGHYWLNEINPLPGFTKISLYPKMWEAAGLSQTDLWHELICLSLHRHRCLAKIRGK